jgi:hypothetical protein
MGGLPRGYLVTILRIICGPLRGYLVAILRAIGGAIGSSFGGVARPPGGNLALSRTMMLVASTRREFYITG